MILSGDFENYEVCHATSIELDIIQACYDFCVNHIADFGSSWCYEEMTDYLTTDESEIYPDSFGYFTYEVLVDYMNSHAPIGCYFGSHEGDATLGYWRILEYDQIGYEYADCLTLAYKKSGYPVFYTDDDMGCKMTKIEVFLEKFYPDQSLCSDFHEIVSGLTMTGIDSPIETIKFCEKLIASFIEKIVPLIAHDHMTWRLQGDTYGIYPELADYEIDESESQ